MKNFNLLKKVFFDFSRKLKKNQNKQTYIKIDSQTQKEQQNPEEIQKTITELLQQGYSEAEVIKIIQNRQNHKQTEAQKFQEAFENVDKSNLPQKMQQQIQSYEKAYQLIENYKQNDSYLLKKSQNHEELQYEELLEQIIEGNSIIDNESFKNSQNLAKEKSFSRNDLIKIEKARQLKLEQRAEIELVKKQFLEISNFETQNKNDSEYSYLDDIDESIDPEKVTPIDKDDRDFLVDWKNQMDDAELSNAEKASFENYYIEEFGITRKEAKQIMKEDFFRNQDHEKQINQRIEANKKRERQKMIQKVFNTIQKRSLQKLDYENEEQYSRKQEIHAGPIKDTHEHLDDIQQKLIDRINNEKKEVLYDKWEIAKKRYSNNIKLILDDVLTGGKFSLKQKTLNYMILIDDVIISENAHFIYVLWDFFDENINKDPNVKDLKIKIDFELNKDNKELCSKIFFELGLRKAPNIVFIHSDKRHQSMMLREDYINEELKKELDNFSQKYPEQYQKLIDSGQFNKFIEEKKQNLRLFLFDKFDNFFSSRIQMRVKEQQIKKQLQDQKKIKKDKKNRHQNPKKSKKKNNVDKFWDKISINQISKIDKPSLSQFNVKQILFSEGEISQLPINPQ